MTPPLPPPRPASSGLHFDPIRGTTTSAAGSSQAPSQPPPMSAGYHQTQHAGPTTGRPGLLSPPVLRQTATPYSVSSSSSSHPSPSQQSYSSVGARPPSSRHSGSAFSIANIIDPPDTAPTVSRGSHTHSRSGSYLDGRHPHHYSPSSAPSPVPGSAMIGREHQHGPPPSIQQQHRPQQPQQQQAHVPQVLSPPLSSRPAAEQVSIPASPVHPARVSAIIQSNVPPEVPARPVEPAAEPAAPLEEPKNPRKRKSTGSRERAPAAKKRHSEPAPATEAPPPEPTEAAPPKPTRTRQRKSVPKASTRKSGASRDGDESILETDAEVSVLETAATADKDTSTDGAAKRVTKPRRAPRPKKASPMLTSDIPGSEQPADPSSGLAPAEPETGASKAEPVETAPAEKPVATSAEKPAAELVEKPLGASKPKPERKKRASKAAQPAERVVEDVGQSDSAMDVDSTRLSPDPDSIEIPAAALLGAFVPLPLSEAAASLSVSLMPPAGAANGDSKNSSTPASKAPSQTSTLTPPMPVGQARASGRKGVDFSATIALLPGMGGGPVGESGESTGSNIWLTFSLKGQNNVTLNFAREVERKYGQAALNPRVAAHNSRRKAIWKMGEELERQERARKVGTVDDGSGDDLESVDLNSDDDRGSDGDPIDVDSDARKRAGSPTHSSEERARLQEMQLDPEKWKFAKNGRLIRRRKRRTEEYDRNDEFIDDAEMAWDEQARMAQDGFFVYSGPLVLDGVGPTANGKPESKAARPRAKPRSKAAISNAAATTANADDSAGAKPAAPKAPRSRAKAAGQANGAAGAGTTTTRKRPTKADKAAAAAAAAAAAGDGGDDHSVASSIAGVVPPAATANAVPS